MRSRMAVIPADPAQISTAMRVLAETIASDVSLLVTFNQAIEGAIQKIPRREPTQKRWRNWTAIRGQYGSLSANLPRLGMRTVPGSLALRGELLLDSVEFYLIIWK